MKTASKLAALVAAVTVAFGAAAAVGEAVGPIDVGSANEAHEAHGDAGEILADLPRGLAVATAGHRLTVDATTITASADSTFGFTIVDDAGAAVTRFDTLHERALHLIVLSRNMVDYLHLHPTMDTSGHWTVELPALDPGSYRMFADFQPTGSENLTLGTDVTVPGDNHSVDVPAPSTVATVDGYTVTIKGTAAVGDSDLEFTVALNGQIVRTDRYLGAAGHLVVIRSGDLAYLHVHPHDESHSSVVTFTGDFPTAGTYRLFFDFSHDGAVRTASFTVTIGSTAVARPTTVTREEDH